MWPEYRELLNTMRKNYELWAQLSNEAWTKYSETWQKAVDSDPEIHKSVGEAWKDTSFEAGMEQMKKFSQMWENTLKTSSMDAMFEFVRYWQKFWFASNAKQFRVYNKALEKFTEMQKKYRK